MADSLFDMIPIKKARFVVKNITPDRKKTIHLFGFPIPYLQKRDLLEIPSVDESIIRDSLLRGVLKNRILVRDILVVDSDINLVQYNLDQRDFLASAGIVVGIDSNVYKHKVNVPLEGDYDGVCRVYKVQDGEKFINDAEYLHFEYKIQVFHNGRLLLENVDYLLKESITGKGFDQVKFITFAPTSNSALFASYYVLW